MNIRSILSKVIRQFLFGLILLLVAGCPVSGFYDDEPLPPDTGGVYDNDLGLWRVHMPFARGTTWRCTQGVRGNWSHQGRSTQYGLDWDTPNSRPNYPTLYAPVGGRVHVHYDDEDFGYAVHIELDDEYFLLLAHLDQILVRDGDVVSLGEPLGKAGCTGNCTGEHVHMGVQRGDASRPAEWSTSVYWAVFAMDMEVGAITGAEAHSVWNVQCGQDGPRYESQLPIDGDTGPDPRPDDDVEICARFNSSYAQIEMWVDTGAFDNWPSSPECTAHDSRSVCCDVPVIERGVVLNGSFSGGPDRGLPPYFCTGGADSSRWQPGGDGLRISLDGEDLGRPRHDGRVSFITNGGTGCNLFIHEDELP